MRRKQARPAYEPLVYIQPWILSCLSPSRRRPGTSLPLTPPSRLRPSTPSSRLPPLTLSVASSLLSTDTRTRTQTHARTSARAHKRTRAHGLTTIDADIYAEGRVRTVPRVYSPTHTQHSPPRTVEGGVCSLPPALLLNPSILFRPSPTVASPDALIRLGSSKPPAQIVTGALAVERPYSDALIRLGTPKPPSRQPPFPRPAPLAPARPFHSDP